MVRTVAVIGTGLIGASWAACFLARGLDVVASDPAAAAEARLREAVQSHWPALARFAATVREMPEIVDAYRMAGEVDYMLKVAVPDMAEFDGFYKRLIDAVPLKNVTSRFAMERLKQTTAFPLPNRAFRDRRGVEAEE